MNKATLIATVCAATTHAVRLNSMLQEEDELAELFNEFAGDDNAMDYDEFLALGADVVPELDAGTLHNYFLNWAGDDDQLDLNEFKQLVDDYEQDAGSGAGSGNEDEEEEGSEMEGSEGEEEGSEGQGSGSEGQESGSGSQDEGSEGQGSEQEGSGSQEEDEDDEGEGSEGSEGGSGSDAADEGEDLGPISIPQLQKLFDKYDTDNDGKLSQQDWVDLYFDPSFDGPLSQEQLRTYFDATAGDDQMMDFEELVNLVRIYGDDMQVEESEGAEEGSEGKDQEEGEEEDEGEDDQEEEEKEDQDEEGEDQENEGDDLGPISRELLSQLFTTHDTNNNDKLSQQEWLNLYFDPQFDGPASEEMLIIWFKATSGRDQQLTFTELENLIKIYGDMMVQED